jgi:hypothetical protein
MYGLMIANFIRGLVMNIAAKVSMKKFAGAIAVASMLIVSSAANAEVLTFDDLATNSIPNGYGGLQWDNFGNQVNNPVSGSGYETGIVSGLNTAYNRWGNPATFSSAVAFTLNSAFFTGAWNDGLQIHVVATGVSNTYTTDFAVDTSGPLNVVFNWLNINSVSFSSSGGLPHPGLIGNGTQFVMDNLAINEVVSPVPEPETYAMLLVGLGLIGFMARRRENANFF